MTSVPTFFRTALLMPLILTLAIMAPLTHGAEVRTLAMAESPTSRDVSTVSEVVVRKGERRLDLLADGQVVRSYRISLGRTPEGHKLYEGDSRTPEGRYTLDFRNPNSEFHKSIRISYPNRKDRELAAAWGLEPGGNIMIHGLPNEVGDLAFAYRGLDWTDGCIAVTNEEMDEIWQLVDVGTPIRILP
ncbi:MAG: L,D-transpeptidase family protein [Marinobacter sp.]